MSLIIRLKPRSQLKSSAYFSIIVINKKRSAKSNAIKENLGFYDKNLNILCLNFYRLFFWLSKGVKISDSFYKLLFYNFLLFNKEKWNKV